MSMLTNSRSCLLLSKYLPLKVQKRFSIRESIHRYVEPEKFKKHMLAATQPYFKQKYELPSESCKGHIRGEHDLHPLDEIYADELYEEIRQNDFVLIIQHNYTPFQSERVYKNTITKSGGNFRSHKNPVFRNVFERLEMDNMVLELLTRTRNSLAIGKIEKLPACVIALKKMPQFLLLGGCIDREIYNYQQLVSISEQPNIDLCRANLLAVLETPSVDLSYYLEQHVSLNDGKTNDDNGDVNGEAP